MAGTTSLIGQRTIDLYHEGVATREQLDKAHTKGWVSDDDYNAAIPDPEA